MKRFEVNITPIERLGRVVIGAAAALAGIVLLASAGSALAVVLEVLLVLAGLDLVVTGALGHCPLYRRLGYVPPLSEEARMNRKSPATPPERAKGGHGHGWMMIACCIPMLAIAVALVATGVVGVGFIFIALACTAMMAVMMRGMSHEGGGERDRSHGGHHT